MKKSTIMLILAVFCAQMLVFGDTGLLVSAECKTKKKKHSLIKKSGKKSGGNLTRGWSKTKKRGR